MVNVMKIDIPAFKMPKFKYKKAGADLKKAFTKLSEGGFEKIFKQIDQLNIKKELIPWVLTSLFSSARY